MISLHDLDRQILTYCSKNRIMGVLQVRIKDEMVYEQKIGFADIARCLPFRDDSMFSLYSLSKPFCAIGLMKLYDKGLFSLQDHPGMYIPEAKAFDKDLQILHLLNHTSGLPDFAQSPGFSELHLPGFARFARSHLKDLSEFPPFFTPGSAGKYSNVNFLICALIIENISGMKYSDYMRKEVLEPLSMRYAVVDNEELMIQNRVKGYVLDGDQLCECVKSHDWMLGAGDIVATADDVYCLNAAIKNRMLLRESTWSEILTPSPLNNMGFGCTISNWHGHRRITHNGGHTGFRTLHIQLPEDDFDMIFLSNCGYGNARHDISELVYPAFYKDSSSVSDVVEMDKGYI